MSVATAASPPKDRFVGTTVWAEVALTAVTLSIVFGLGRLFVDGSFLGPLIAVAVAAHLLAAACRRSRLNPWAVAAIGLLGGFVVITLVRYPGTTTFGVPSWASFRAPADDLRRAWRDFSDVVAPAPVTSGFVLASAIAIWLMAWFADWAAFRLGAVVEATLPAGAIFIFSSMLGDDRYQIAASSAFAATVLSFCLLHTTDHRARRTVWVGDGAPQGSRSLLRAGAAVVTLATLAGVLLGPHLPGAGSASLLDWRGGRDSSATRITVSPLVDIRKRLVDQSNVVLFTVESNRRAYWRLTSLDTFDGTVWSSGGSFARVNGRLPGTADPRPKDAIEQSYSISGLDAIWLPAAYAATNVSTDGTKVRFDDESGTLIVDASSDTSNGVAYEVVSDQPLRTPEQLSRSDLPPPSDIAGRYLALPGSFPANVTLKAEGLVQGATNTYARALALQDFFRDNFTYDLNDTQSGHSDDAIEDFLVSRRGYCEQFAGTFAAMARAVGIPSRVAVGFTPGDPDPDRPDRYVVRGRHAHAWPEVWIEGQGWVAFEPTPGRGMPGAESYTGVPEGQDDGRGNGTAPSTVSTTAPAAGDTTPIPSAPSPVDRGQTPPPPGSASGGKGGTAILTRAFHAVLVLIALAGLWILGLAAFGLSRRRKRRRGATTASAQVRLAWVEGTESVGLLASPLDPAETEREFSVRVRPFIGDTAGSLDRLAQLTTVATWASSSTGSADVEEAQTLSATIRDQVAARVGRRHRLRRLIDPRRFS